MTRGAGGGRPSKGDQGRNRNTPTKGEIVLSADARVADPPAALLTLNQTQLMLWDSMWQHPVATLWTSADVAPLCRLVILQASKRAHFDDALLREMRQLEDRFLLNPYSRAQQKVIIERSDAPGSSSVAEVTQLDGYRSRMQGGRPPAKKPPAKKRKKPPPKPS